MEGSKKQQPIQPGDSDTGPRTPLGNTTFQQMGGRTLTQSAGDMNASADNSQQIIPVSDISVSVLKLLKDNASMLTRNMDPENVMSVLNEHFSFDEKEYIRESGKASSLSILTTLKQQLTAGSTIGYECFLKALAGLHVDLFEVLTGRKPKPDESDFCMKKFNKSLKEEIIQEGHKVDNRTDEVIDLDKQYVELRVVPEVDSPETPKAETSKPEGDVPNAKQAESNQAKHYYNSAMQILDTEINTGKSCKVLLVGRAGIGKSTTIQWLFRKWAKNEWADGFTAVFLIRLRHLLMCPVLMSLLELLTKYNLCRHKQGTLHPKWVLNHQIRVMVILDGWDEINLSESDFLDAPEITDINEPSNPLAIVINLMRGRLIPDCTLICTSRYSKGFCTSFDCRMFEIHGLTQDAVQSYIHQNYDRTDAKRIYSLLQGNPLLLSVCAVTYYCSVITHAICDDPSLSFENVDTFTRLHSFIVQKNAIRKLGGRSATLEFQTLIPKLAKLSFNGLFSPDKIWSQIIFAEKHLMDVRLGNEDVAKAVKLGILVYPTKSEARELQVQFLHLSIQELFAGTHVLADNETISDVFLEDRMKMVTKFMFGFHFDSDSQWNGCLLETLSKKNQTRMHKFLYRLLSFFLETKIVSPQERMGRDLFCCQLAFESQRDDIAKKVADRIIHQKKFVVSNVLITALETKSIIFTCKQSLTLQKIELVNTNLDDISVGQIAHHLTDNSSLQHLNLSSNQVKGVGMKALGDMLRVNQTLQHLQLDGNDIEDDAVLSLVAGLQKNTTLTSLSLANNLISDQGAEGLAESITKRHALKNLNLSHNQVSHMGINALIGTFDALHHSVDASRIKGKEMVCFDLRNNPCDLKQCKQRAPGFLVSGMKNFLPFPSQSLVKLSKAKIIHLHDACLTDEDFAKISALIACSDIVEEVHLQNNSFTPWIIPYLNTLIFTCRRLKSVKLSGNSIPDNVVDKFGDMSIKIDLKTLIFHVPTVPLPYTDPFEVVILPGDLHACLQRVCSILITLEGLESLSLNLWGPLIDQSHLKCVESMIAHCCNLKHFSIKGAMFAFENLDSFLLCLKDMKALESMEMSDCFISIHSLEQVIKSICHIPRLKRICLQNMDHAALEVTIPTAENPRPQQTFNGGKIQRIILAVQDMCECLQNFDHLESLDLSGTQLSDTGAMSIGQLLTASKSIQVLQLNKCRIGPRGCKCLGKAIATNRSLLELGLDQNPLGDVGLKYLSEGLSLNQYLLSLSLGKSNITDDGIEYLSQALKTNSTLEVLDLRGLQIDLGAVALRDALKTNTALMELGMPFIFSLKLLEEIKTLVNTHQESSPENRQKRFRLRSRTSVTFRRQLIFEGIVQ